MRSLQLLGVGLLGGVLSGMFGIGGGVVMVPLLMLLGFGATQAAGTSLAALVPPVGLLAALEYHRKGLVEVGDAGLLALGIVVGAWASARVAVDLPTDVARKVFGGFLVAIGVRFLVLK